jgi:N-methylhydantoinase A
MKPAANHRYVVGVDVGGTFTDVFFLDEATGSFNTAKVPSTRGDQASGFLNGVKSGVQDLRDVATVVHGTTVGTNALLERKGGRTGVITTAGFRDVLEMRRRDRPRTWGLWGQFEPVVGRELRLEVAERTLADGTVRQAVDVDEVKAAARKLLALGAEAVSIIFINAYANDANERAALKAVREVWPNANVNASSEILPEIREYERASTTALNAYLQPPVGTYLHRLEDRLKGDGFGGEVLIVQSNGGVMSVDTARRLPVRTALSGPAAGVIASSHIANAAGFPNVITCDMGGTSFDVSLIAANKTVLAAQTAVDFGLVIRTPMIEITTIGAGGGSIAWIDRGGLLQIGPESAGSDPGPVCYGLGNTRPTVTDANLVLGRINADRPIGGKLDRLDVDAAKAAIDLHVGKPLNLDTMAAAEAIVRVANSRMAGAIRLVSIERGYNPRQFAAMPFGGGGGLHVGALIKEVGLANALVPRFPGVTSALGCVIADMRHDFVRTINQLLDKLDIAQLDALMVETAEAGLAQLRQAGVRFEGTVVEFEFDMSYLGQTHTVVVPLHLTPANGTTGITGAKLRAAFEAAYRGVYGRLLENIAIRVLNLRTAVIGFRPKFDLAMLAPAADATVAAAKLGQREVWVEGGWHEAAIYARLKLPVDAVIAGPALLEQPDTTIFIEPDLEARVDRFGNLIVQRKGSA